MFFSNVTQMSYTGHTADKHDQTNKTDSASQDTSGGSKKSTAASQNETRSVEKSENSASIRNNKSANEPGVSSSSEKVTSEERQIANAKKLAEKIQTELHFNLFFNLDSEENNSVVLLSDKTNQVSDGNTQPLASVAYQEY